MRREGQHLAVASIEVCTRILARDNEVSIRWVPAHHGVLGNEKADEYAKAAARGESQRGPASMVPDQYRWETSLSHMSRVATEARSRAAARWMADRFGGPRRNYRPPPGRGLRRKLLRGAPKSIASRYYQLLSGHAAIGPFLKDKIHKAADDKCWWCGGGKQQTRHHFFTQCRAWLPQIRTLWRDIGKALGWKHPRAPSGKWLWKEESTEAVLAYLGSTRVGYISAGRRPPEEVDANRTGDRGEEGGPGPPNAQSPVSPTWG